MELINFIGLLATILPLAYGAPTQASSTLHPQILEAMKRDLGLDAEQATARVAREVSAADIIENLRSSAGEKFAGAWLTDDGETINVGVTDQAAADEVTAAGAKPIMMANSFTKLRDAKKALDKLHNSQVKTLESKSGVASWYVDVVANKLVLKAVKGSTAEAKDMAAQVGLSESDFEVQTVDKMPVTFASIQGGDAYLIGGARCSVGFAVSGGFVSAGHCGTEGSQVTTQDGEAYGSFSGSVFPGDADMSFISTVEGTQLNPTINGYGGAGESVTGNSVAPIGSSICRSGSTTGVHCGTVNNFEVSVQYPEGTITGLTETNVCAEPGDSGGSFYTGGEAQGVTSGGSGDCSSGGTTYFQPVNEILSTYGLTLITA